MNLVPVDRCPATAEPPRGRPSTGVSSPRSSGQLGVGLLLLDCSPTPRLYSSYQPVLVGKQPVVTLSPVPPDTGVCPVQPVDDGLD